MNFEISVADTPQAIMSTFAVMHQLRPSMLEEDYLSTVQSMQHEDGFRLALLRSNGHVACVAGYRYCRALGWGKYLYVEDLVTDIDSRSTGCGKAMLDWLVEQAKAEGCDQLRLDSATYRYGAHRFYLRERMDITCFHFARVLSDYKPDDVKE